MKKVLSAVACAAVIGWVGSAMAAPITFTDVVDINTWLSPSLSQPFPSVSYSHNFTFNPPAQSVISGLLTVEFVDDDADRSIFSKEFAYGYTDSGNFDWGEVNTGAYQYSILGSTLADGLLTVTIRSTGFSDFYVGRSSLDVTYNPVPEPTTMLLFGTGLAGLAAIGRRRKEA